MSLDKDGASKNFSEFIAKHGIEGFVKLFLTNYLSELVLYYLHSESKEKEDNTSFFFYYSPSQKKTYTPQEIDKFKADLQKECGKRAELIVEQLKSMNLLGSLEQDPLTNPKLLELVEQAVKSILGQTERG